MRLLVLRDYEITFARLFHTNFFLIDLCNIWQFSNRCLSKSNWTIFNDTLIGSKRIIDAIVITYDSSWWLVFFRRCTRIYQSSDIDHLLLFLFFRFLHLNLRQFHYLWRCHLNYSWLLKLLNTLWLWFTMNSSIWIDQRIIKMWSGLFFDLMKICWRQPSLMLEFTFTLDIRQIIAFKTSVNRLLQFIWLILIDLVDHIRLLDMSFGSEYIRTLIWNFRLLLRHL